MKGVRVDPAQRTVRVGPGCTQGDVDHATHAFGLAVPAGIVSTTGVAGLTLGGGHGYLSRKYGLTIDNLIEADVVLADGSFVTASDSSHPDLFWALRGGGGNFGVVTSFVFRAHPVDQVYAGPIFWEQKDARRIMQWYREFLPGSPRELGAFVGLKTVPSADPFPKEIQGRKICALVSCYSGPVAEGEALMNQVRKDLPPPILDWMGAMPFPALQGLFDPLLPKGLQWYWKGDFVKELPDAAIDVHLEHAAESPSELSLMHLYPIDGAVHEVAAARDGLELPRRDLVDGHRGHRSGAGEGGRGVGVGQELLGGRAPLHARRRLRELHDGGRRGSHPRDLRRATTTAWPPSRASTTRTTSSASTRTSGLRHSTRSDGGEDLLFPAPPVECGFVTDGDTDEPTDGQDECFRLEQAQPCQVPGLPGHRRASDRQRKHQRALRGREADRDHAVPALQRDRVHSGGLESRQIPQ